MKNKTYTYLFIIALFLLNGCKDFVQVEIPPNQLSSANVFRDKATIEAVLSGIYSDLSNVSHPLNADMQIAVALNSDELTYFGNIESYRDFNDSAVQKYNSIVTNTWMYTYRTIYGVNAAIEGLMASKDLDDNIRRQYLGEAKFLRAFCYMYLINLYGDVPLIIGTDYEKNSNEGRTSVTLVYDQIISDLEESKTSLSKAYVKTERTRPNYFTACALLARVYLYLGNWQEAENLSNAVIDGSFYRLVDPSKVFVKESEEVIWQLMPVDALYNTNIGRILIPSTRANVIPDYCLTQDLIQTFSVNDERLLYWVGKRNVNDREYYFPYKYKIQIGSNPNEYLVMFRLAEQYLIRAEARMHLSNIKGSLDDLNIIRNRAGLENLTTLSQEEIMEAIVQERRHEFMAEWGHRWFDLKRTGKINETLVSIKGSNWQASDALWPIPQSQIETNTHLDQNPGY